MATLPGLNKGVTKDPTPPATDTVISPITIPDGTTLVTTKTTNETIDNVDQLIDYVSGDVVGNFIPQLAIQNLVSDLAAKEDTVNKGAVSGYAGLDASQELLLANFPSGTGLQVLRRNSGNTALEFATLSDLQGITSINADTNAAQIIAGTTNQITVGTVAGTTTIDVGSNVVLTSQSNIYTAGTRQDFLGELVGTAGLNIGGIAGDPTTQVNGDIWLNTATNQIFGRINGVDIDLGVGGEFTGAWTANHNQGGSIFSLEDARFADPTDDTKTIQLNLAGMTTAIELIISTSQTTAQTLTIPNITAAATIIVTGLANQITNTELTTGAFAKITGVGTQAQDLVMGSNGITGISNTIGLAFDSGASFTATSTFLTASVAINDFFVINVDSQNEYFFGAGESDWQGNDLTDVKAVRFFNSVILPAAGNMYIQEDSGFLKLNVATGESISLTINAVAELILNATSLNIDEKFLDIGEIATPGNPGVNVGRLYVADDGATTTLFFRDNAGVETNLLAIASTVVQTDQANTYVAGNKQSFVADATTAGLNINAQIPSAPAIGDIFRSAEILRFIGTTTTEYILVSDGQPTTYTAGVRQDFLGELVGTAGLNVGGIAGNPTTQINGDIWLNTSTNQIFGRINGVDVDLGAGGGSGITSINADTTAAQIIAGTTNVITVATVTGTTTIDIDAAYVGQASITTLGTITTGVWNGTAITGANINAASTDLTDSAVIARSTNNLSFFAATTSLQLAGVISDETGSGLLVFGTSPTIVTPTIASFLNAGHNHEAAAGGGQLDSTLALSDTANIAYLNTVNTFIAGNLNTFAHDATNPGLAVLPIAGDPSGRADGAIWLNVTSQQLFSRINGADVDLGAGGGTGDVVGPASAADTELVRFSGTTGKIIQATTIPVLMTTAGEPTWPRAIFFTNFTTAAAGNTTYIQSIFSDISLNVSTGNEFHFSINNVNQMVVTATQFQLLNHTMLNMGLLNFDLGGSTALAATEPYIHFSTALTPDAIVLNVPSANEFLIEFANVEKITFEASLVTLATATDLNAGGDVIVGDRFQGNKGADIASASTITLGDGNYFDITGNADIDFMTTTGWQAGSMVVLQFDANSGANDETASPPVNTVPFALAGVFNASAGDTLTVVFDGAFWREISRSVN